MKNELIKIFKRRSIYFLLLISIVVIFIYNEINSDQNVSTLYNSDTSDINVADMELVIKNQKYNIDEYINQKSSIDFGKLYNTFEKNSWQRYALNEELSNNSIENVYTDYNLDIFIYLKNINDYELNNKTKISSELYKKSKDKYQEYVNVLNLSNWKEYANLKIKILKKEKIRRSF